jgi:hypothetical protein
VDCFDNVVHCTVYRRLRAKYLFFAELLLFSESKDRSSKQHYNNDNDNKQTTLYHSVATLVLVLY